MEKQVNASSHDEGGKVNSPPKCGGVWTLTPGGEYWPRRLHGESLQPSLELRLQA